jgi:hypothetical protein
MLTTRRGKTRKIIRNTTNRERDFGKVEVRVRVKAMVTILVYRGCRKSFSSINSRKYKSARH